MAKGMFRAAAAAGLLVGFVGAAQAGITWFNNRATWAAAAGAASFSEDFSGFAADTSFRAAPVALSGMSIAQEGANVTSFRNLIDALPHVFGDSNGTTQFIHHR